MKKNYWDKVWYGILAFLILSIAYICTEPLYAPDTVEYIAAYAYLPALYPLFLWLLRILFGNTAYIYIAIFIQTFFAAWVVVCLTELLHDVFKTGKFTKNIIFFLLLLTYFKVDEYHPGCNIWILTEGLSYSLFYMFVYYGIIFLKEKTCSVFIKLVITSTALMLCRTQFIVCFGMLVLYIGYLLVFEKIKMKKGLYLLAGVISGLILVNVIQAGYKQIADKTDVNMFNSLSIGTHLYYYATEEDAFKIEDEFERQLFLDIHEEIVLNGYDYKGKEEKWLDGVASYKNSFLQIRGIISSNIMEYVQQMEIENEMEIDEIASQVLERQMEALYSHFWLWAWDALKQFPVTMVRVVALYPEKPDRIVMRGFFMAYAAILYGLYLVVNIALFARTKRLQAENIFCIFLIIFTLVNAVITEMTIRSLIRYVAYSFGLFYISGLLVLLALFRNRNEVKVET